MKFINRITKYIDIIIGVIIAYVLIRVIDNYNYFFNIFGKAKAILTPFIYAFIIAYVLNPLMNLFERKLKLKRWISICLTYAIIIGLLVLSVTTLIPKVVDSIIDIASNVPYYATVVQDKINEFLSNPNVQNILSSTNYMDKINLNFITSKGSELLVSSLNSIVSNMVTFTGSLIKWIFGFIISIYILADKENFLRIGRTFTYMILKEKIASKFLELVGNVHHMIGVYIGIKAIDSLIIAVMAFVGMTILKIPYTMLLAVIVGITNMIPYFGPFLGMLVAFVINMFISPVKAVVVLIFLFLLQQFDGWYLDPKLIGGKVGLHPFLVILAVTIGGGVYGAVGMILSVPIMAVIKIYMDRIIKKNVKDNGYTDLI